MNKTVSTEERIEQLRNEINEYDYRYHVLDDTPFRMPNKTA